MEAQQIVRNMADESGVINPEASSVTEPSVEVDFDINIRQDEVRLFETESGRQFLRTPEMDEGVFVEPVPTSDGFTAEVVVEPQVDVDETSPADRQEQPDVESISHTETVEVMD